MQFWIDWYHACKTVIIPLVILMIATVIVFFTVSHDTAWVVSYLGTPIILMANIIYILRRS